MVKKINIPKELLYREYVEKGMSASAIARELRVCIQTILNRLMGYEIPIRDKINISKEFLHQEYIVKKKTSTQIAKERGVSGGTIINRLKENKFPRRNSGRKRVDIPKEKLEEMYKKSTSIDAIARKLGVSTSIIIKCLKEYNIQRKSRSEAQKKVNISKDLLNKMYVKDSMSILKIAKKLGVSNAPVRRCLKELGFTIRGKMNISKEFLYQEYVVKKKTSVQIAKEKRVSYVTIINRLKEYGIKIRKSISIERKERARKRMKENNPMGNPESVKKLSKTKQEKWKDPKFQKKMWKACSLKPNKPETVLINLFKQQNLPYKYTGDYRFWIEGRNPDFVNVNGEKKVIEMFGDYWHNPLLNRKMKLSSTYDETIKHYGKYGFDCLIIWEKELNNIEEVKQKIITFDNI